MLELWVFVGCGASLNPFRDIAVDVIEAVERMFVFDLDVSLVLRNWDWRDEPPELVASGGLASRSLRMVERSQAVVAVLGATIPAVTRKEIHRAIERFQAGGTDRVWLFVDKTKKTDVHSRFVKNVQRRHKIKVVYQTYDTKVDFQRKLFIALTPYVVRKAILDRQTQIVAAAGGSA